VAERLHRERVEVAEQNAEAEERRDEIGHQAPERRMTRGRERDSEEAGRQSGDAGHRCARQQPHAVARHEA
jgi:hypothetical protein